MIGINRFPGRRETDVSVDYHKPINLKEAWDRKDVCLLEEARLVFDVVFVVPLPPGSLQVLDTLLLRGSHFQVPLFQIPASNQ